MLLCAWSWWWFVGWLLTICIHLVYSSIKVVEKYEKPMSNYLYSVCKIHNTYHSVLLAPPGQHAQLHTDLWTASLPAALHTHLPTLRSHHYCINKRGKIRGCETAVPASLSWHCPLKPLLHLSPCSWATIIPHYCNVYQVMQDLVSQHLLSSHPM